MIGEETTEAGPSLASVVESGPVAPSKSVLAQLRESAKKARANKTVDLPIPSYDGLFVTFRVLDDYSEVRSTLVKVLKRKGLSPADRDIAIAVRTLLMSSVGSFALIDGVRTDIGLPLGCELYDQLWPAERDDEYRPQDDAEALLLLFDSNTVQITTLAAQLDQWFKNTNVRLDEDLLGE